MGKLSVGQKLWYVPRDSREVSQSREVTVTKIGRKWAEIDMGWRGSRIDLEDWRVDGGQYSSPGSCYVSRQAWDDERQRQRAWSSLFSARPYGGPPDHVTTAAIYQAASLLGIELPARSDTGETK